jgi:hypothetical protein
MYFPPLPWLHSGPRRTERLVAANLDVEETAVLTVVFTFFDFLFTANSEIRLMHKVEDQDIREKNAGHGSHGKRRWRPGLARQSLRGVA